MEEHFARHGYLFLRRTDKDKNTARKCQNVLFFPTFHRDFDCFDSSNASAWLL